MSDQQDLNPEARCECTSEGDHHNPTRGAPQRNGAPDARGVHRRTPLVRVCLTAGLDASVTALEPERKSWKRPFDLRRQRSPRAQPMPLGTQSDIVQIDRLHMLREHKLHG